MTKPQREAFRDDKPRPFGGRKVIERDGSMLDL
jgi:hypothetical protein